MKRKTATQSQAQFQKKRSFFHESFSIKELSSSRPRDFISAFKPVISQPMTILEISQIEEFEIDELVGSDDIEIAVNMNEFKLMWQHSQDELRQLKNRVKKLSDFISRNNQIISELLHKNCMQFQQISNQVCK